mgnify:CR=1 FL=1
MAQVRLLSIKRNEEASYFYESNGSTSLDSNKNEVVEVEENHTALQNSKNVKKREERASKKEQKQKIKELKQREKEKKKSVKTSRKKVMGSVDTSKSSDRMEVNGNDDVNTNGGFQAGMDTDETAKNKNEGSLKDHEADRNENEEWKQELSETQSNHEGASSLHEDLPKEDKQVKDEFSVKTHDESFVEVTGPAIAGDEPDASRETPIMSSEGHTDRELNSESHLEKPREVEEEVITADSAEASQEAPKDVFFQPKANPGIAEPAGGQHVEIEISEVTDLEPESASSSNQVVVMQTVPQTSSYDNNAAIEGQILVATVQEVESSVDLDTIFAECGDQREEEDKEEKRKSVRFQDETEEIESEVDEHELLNVESEDHEHASMNLGGDFTESTDDDSAQPTKTLEPAVEVVSKEEQSKVESCANLDEVFAASEQETNDREAVSKESRVVMTKVNGSLKVSGKTKVSANGGTNMDEMEEINLNELNEHKNIAPKKKEKKKRSGLYRCCFP